MGYTRQGVKNSGREPYSPYFPDLAAIPIFLIADYFTGNSSTTTYSPPRAILICSKFYVILADVSGRQKAEVINGHVCK
jgi:hypothetical protein